jgi:Zn-dependent protease/predicted transcriptional regulator
LFKSSVTIMRVSGIPIRLHVSFLVILFVLVFVIGNNIGAIADMAGVAIADLSVSPYALGLGLALLLFISIALHELAHSFVARSQGIEIRDITLMLLGGVAQMNDEAEERDEIWMAFAGPLFSLVFGVVLLFLVRPVSALVSADLHLVVYYLGFMNVFLGFFNLLPAFPSDGGRILRSLIARRTSYLQATRIATGIGRTFALLFAVSGLLIGNLFLVLVAFFIYIGASQEYQLNVVKDAFSDFKVSDLMTHEVSTVHQDVTVAGLLDRMLNERHLGYPVVDDDGQMVGCVTLQDIQALTEGMRQSSLVREIMTRELITIRPADELFYAFKRLSEADIGRLMVVEDGDLKGILTRSDIMKAYRIKAFQKEQVRVAR